MSPKARASASTSPRESSKPTAAASGPKAPARTRARRLRWCSRWREWRLHPLGLPRRDGAVGGVDDAEVGQALGAGHRRLALSLRGQGEVFDDQGEAAVVVALLDRDLSAIGQVLAVEHQRRLPGRDVQAAALA